MSPRPRAKDYLQSLPNDITSSIVVFLVALPLCLGVALASNAPPLSGIIAGVSGGIVVGLASRSHLSVSGPAAGLTTIVAAAIGLLGSFQLFLAAVVIAGVLQIVLGFAKAGVIGDYIPNCVIKGMLAAIGLILILNQVPHLLGDDSHFVTDEGVVQDKGNIFTNFVFAFTHINTAAIIIGVTCLMFYFLWEKLVSGKKSFLKFIPAPLIIVFIGVGLNVFFSNSGMLASLAGGHLVKIPESNSANEFFSFFTFPDFSQVFSKDVLVIAVTLALVASLESLLSIEAIDDLDPFQRVTPTNRELKAQGLGNIVSGMLGGLPVTSVIVRSSANVNAGAKTKMSTIYHGTLLLLSFAFIPFLLNMIPKAALAAILIFTGYKLAKPALFKAFYKKGWDQFLPFVITITAILATDLLKGVIIGIVAGLFFVLRSNFKTAVFVVNDENKYLFRLRKDVSFLNKPIIKNKLEMVPENSYVLIDATRADFIDKDIIETIEDFMLHAHLKNIKVEVKKGQNRYQGFSDKLPPTMNKRTIRTHEKEIVEEVH
ncbi:MAG TPA: SulP family inorganic anion transporter [Chitinophagaceae bacterium]|jgi:MFS superfamily sulfate permease-like transporter|nr:SulP family inorganic anion transporter [Chitinophagaceae bacterium]OPZ17283.1 MAG: C4-dicarboxylic acid transporter DauA [Bacteroidetes bacterium ADurb.BinA245]HMX77248.1 SulP family inorganic anion transporter [Chitinophagaceae bacterium]HNA90642.1 SulP family inorganic anion transporter [Chitinophagaceae bacterium]HNA96778.1 SulP family inorganic anion transporter [Chitinophagaceae bacterium]